MDERTYNLAIEINEELNKNKDVLLLNEAEKKMNDSYEVYSLSNKKDEALEKYISNKEIYGADHELTVKSRNELKKAKEALQNHPLVKEYLEIYSRVRNLYLEIDNILLGDFKKEKKTCR